MRATRIFLAAVLWFVLSSLSASAQSHPEGRGYGGPMYVGPNFKEGGQHAPPVYGAKPKKAAPQYNKPAAAKESRRKAVKPTKAAKAPAVVPEKNTAAKPADKDESQPDETEAREPEAEKAEAKEPESTASEGSNAAATCSKFDANIGKTVSVPCE